MPERSLLLTGATGFVGGAVRGALTREGWRTRCLTRDVARAQKRQPALDWVQGDVAEPASCARALAGCQAALYLVHGIGAGGATTSRRSRRPRPSPRRRRQRASSAS